MGRGLEHRRLFAANQRNPKINYPLIFTTLRKTRKQGRVVEIVIVLVIGVVSLLTSYLKRSRVRHIVNTSFVESQNGTD